MARYSAECCIHSVALIRWSLSPHSVVSACLLSVSMFSFLHDAYRIEPLDIEIGSNYNDYDVNWYKVLLSEDAPSEKDTECVYDVSSIGFGRLDNNSRIEQVVREAQICVYSKYVVPSKVIEENPA